MAEKNRYSASITVNGKRIKEYSHDDKIFVEAKHESEYSIKLNNNSCNRVLAIVSIDGIDVISGKRANNNSPGYIIYPYDSITVKGFRKDDDTVGAFKFTSKENSYSKQTGNKGNEGVISIRFIPEKISYSITNWEFDNWNNEPFIYDHNNKTTWTAGCDKIYYSTSDIITSDTTTSANNTTQNTYHCHIRNENLECELQSLSSNNAKPFDSSTTWGSKVKDSVVKEDFDRSKIITNIEFYYATRESLKTMGVKLKNEKKITYPKGFKDYCKPPKGWE